MLNEMDGVGVRVGASKETKRVAAAECNAGGVESADASGPDVKVGSDNARTNSHEYVSQLLFLNRDLPKFKQSMLVSNKAGC